jgi:Uma2 family endonuclease
MSALPKPRYTLEEYFALELESELKYEYWHGEVFVMSGASPQHERIVRNTLTGLDIALDGRPCEAFPSNLRVKVPASPPYRYPDLTALCGEQIYETIGGLQVLTNPMLIAEVLSPSTESFDRGDKFDYYQSIASFCEYLLLAQDRPHVGHYIKQSDGRWLYEIVQGMDARLEIESLGCALSLSRIYRNVDFALAEKGKYPRMTE